MSRTAGAGGIGSRVCVGGGGQQGVGKGGVVAVASWCLTAAGVTEWVAPSRFFDVLVISGYRIAWVGGE